LEIPDELAGQTIECPACSTSLVVPVEIEMKKCPHCDKVLMASILPQCSWCGCELKENELRKSKEEVLQRWEEDKKDYEYRKNLEKHGEEVRKAFERNISRRL